jgi:hypothetical protein
VVGHLVFVAASTWMSEDNSKRYGGVREDRMAAVPSRIGVFLEVIHASGGGGVRANASRERCHNKFASIQPEFCIGRTGRVSRNYNGSQAGVPEHLESITVGRTKTTLSKPIVKNEMRKFASRQCKRAAIVKAASNGAANRKSRLAGQCADISDQIDNSVKLYMK